MWVQSFVFLKDLPERLIRKTRHRKVQSHIGLGRPVSEEQSYIHSNPTLLLPTSAYGGSRPSRISNTLEGVGHLPTYLKEGVPGSSFREGSEEGDCGPDQDVCVLFCFICAGVVGRQMVGWFSGEGFETWGKV